MLPSCRRQETSPAIETAASYRDVSCRRHDGTYLSTGSKPTFVNVGAAYPNSPLTLFITDDARENFSYHPEEKLDSKDICVTGTLELYKGKPEIVVTKESDIKIE